MGPWSRRAFLATTALPGLCLLAPGDRADAPRGSEQRHRAALNAGWSFHPGDAGASAPGFDDAAWQPVDLPHTWNATDVLDDEPGYRRGVGWYRHRIRAADLDALPGRRRFLVFEGAAQVARVWVNGHRVGAHTGAFTAFCFDVTDALRATVGDAVVAVRVDSRLDPDIPPLSGDFDIHGGLYRNVWLVATEELHLTLTDHASPGVYVDTPGATAGRAPVRVRGTVVNAGQRPRTATVTSQVVDPDGRTVARAASTVTLDAAASAPFEHRAELRDPALWSPDHPNLYTVRTTVAGGGVTTDRVDTPLGVRWLATDPRRGLLLNGRPLRLTGTNRHQDERGRGTALPDGAHRRDLELIARTGANTLRLAHYPQAPEVLRSADELGLLVWEEIPIVNEITESAAFRANCLTMLREMVRQHYNHPSVALWGYMNEVFLGVDGEPEPAYAAAVRALAQELDDLAHAEDPHRLTAMACDASERYNTTGLAGIPDVLGWNCYHGWYGGELDDFGRFLDDQHARFPQRIQWVSEYGAESDSRVHSLRPEAFDYSVEYQAAFLHSYLTQLRARDHLAGSTLWIHFDFVVEERGGAIPHVNAKGLYHADRTPKDVDWLYRAALRTEPVLRLASREWTRRTGVAGTTQPVTVYTNQDTVELWQDGRSLGRRTRGDGYAVTWQVAFTDGTNHLRARAGELDDEVEVDFLARPRRLADRPLPRLAVNVGATSQFVDAGGFVWEADQPYAAGGFGHLGGSPVLEQVNIAGTDQDPLWQAARSGLTGYRLDVANGTYQVVLGFAELSAGAPGQRVFTVHCNGRAVAEGLDLAAEPGPRRPLELPVRVTASGGSGVRVRLTPVTGEPLLSTIDLRRETD